MTTVGRLPNAPFRNWCTFCYPSGYYTDRIIDELRRHWIASAVTCDAGFNDESTDPLILGRFLDGDSIPMINSKPRCAAYLRFSEASGGLPGCDFTPGFGETGRGKNVSIATSTNSGRRESKDLS